LACRVGEPSLFSGTRMDYRVLRRSDRKLLSELIAEIRGLRADLAASAPRAREPIAAYDADVVELLRAISSASEGRKFTVSGLLETISDRAEDRRLRDSIVAALGTVDGRRLGQLLRRVEGADIDSLSVARVGEGRDGIAWRVASSAGLKPAVTVDPSR
jgi:hypothetical protein